MFTAFLNLILILATFDFNLILVFYNQVKDMKFDKLKSSAHSLTN